MTERKPMTVSASLRASVARHRRSYVAACETSSREAAALKEATKEDRAARRALATAQAIAKEVQQKAHRQVSDLVTRCLAAVFDEPYAFHMEFEEKRGRTEARLVFRRGDLEVDPMSAAGGGVVDVAAFALRLSALALRRPGVRRLMVLDEPFRFVSAEYRPRVRALLETLAKETGFQFVIVTHSPEFEVGKVVRIG
jgi:DNA repair exonuclease SbcCD ATPase subunit